MFVFPPLLLNWLALPVNPPPPLLGPLVQAVPFHTRLVLGALMVAGRRTSARSFRRRMTVTAAPVPYSSTAASAHRGRVFRKVFML